MARSEKNLTAVFTDTASAIRAKTGTTEEICPLDFADKINSIQTGGTGGGGGMKAYFEAGGKCGYSKISSFDGVINYSDTENITDFIDMFSYCEKLANIPNIDMSNAESADRCFKSDTALKAVDITINSSSLYAMGSMFRDCSNLETIKITYTNTTKHASCDFIAYNDSNLKTVILNIPGMRSARYGFSYTDVVSANLGQLHKQTGEFDQDGHKDSYYIEYDYVFQKCPNLEDVTLDIGSIPEEGTAYVNLDYAFISPGSPSSRTAPLNITFLNADANVVRSFRYAFQNNTNIEILPAVNCTKASGLDTAFKGCTNLKELKFYNITRNIDLSDCTKMTRDALVEVLNNLATVTSTKTCTLGATNLAKLTDEDKAIATNKGWTLA